MTRLEASRGSTALAPARELTALYRRPLYLRLREQILRDMVSADLLPGQRYGTEGELAERFSVSRNTLRKAISGLEQEGYLSRRRRVGAIAGRRPLSARDPVEETTTAPAAIEVARQRTIVILPNWDDSVEGRFAGQLLRELTSPNLSPPLSVEIRHPNDPITLNDSAGAVIVAADPRDPAVNELRNIAQKGAKVIVYGPQMVWPELVLIADSRRDDIRRAVRRLYDLGHEAVGLVNHDPTHMTFSQSLLGYLDAHQELGRPIPHGALVQHVYGFSGSGEPDVERISAWVCTYLHTARQIGVKCREKGLSIPGDVSIVTFDDPGGLILPEVGTPLTAVREPFAEAASIIHAFIHNWPEDHRGKVTQIGAGAEWIDRGSVAAPRRKGK